jgi:hypothetical protein
MFFCIAVLAVSTHAPAFAAGAIAVGAINGVGVNGVAVGLAENEKTGAAANSYAMHKCQIAKDAKASVRALCHLVGSYTNKCGSVAIDPNARAPGFGWAVASSSTSASRRALAKCKATAGAGAANCVVAATSCDGRAR